MAARDPARPNWDAIETWPRADLEALQEGRLKAMVSYTYERSALIRELWQAAGVSPADIGSIADFRAKAPFLDKDMVKAYRDRTGDPFGGLLCVDPGEISIIGSGSGTSGGDPTLYSWRWGHPEATERFAEPVLVPEGPAPYWGSNIREYWRYGLRPGTTAIVLGARLRGPMFRVFQETSALVVVVSPVDTDALIEAFLLYRPKVMFAAANLLINNLDDIGRKSGLDMRQVIGDCVLLFAGEPISGHSRDLMAQWGVRYYDMNSVGDSGMVGDCDFHVGFHAWADLCYIEIVDPETGAPLEEGRGELAVTTLINDVDPLVRFRCGDFCELSRAVCACGSAHPRYKTLGRIADVVSVEGHDIALADVWPLIEAIPETAAGYFQLVRRAKVMDRLTLRVGYAGTPDLADVERRLSDLIRARLGVVPELVLVPEEELSAMRHSSGLKLLRVVKE